MGQHPLKDVQYQLIPLRSIGELGVDMEVNEDETVLQAAFRQGITLMHGCKEGQCSSCKSVLLDGEAEHEDFSTFALSETEQEEGKVLFNRKIDHCLRRILCRLRLVHETPKPGRKTQGNTGGHRMR